MRHHIVRQNFTNNYEKGVRRAERKSARKNFDIFLKKRFFIFIIVVVVVTEIVTHSRKEISRWKILLQFPHFLPSKAQISQSGIDVCTCQEETSTTLGSLCPWTDHVVQKNYFLMPYTVEETFTIYRKIKWF